MPNPRGGARPGAGRPRKADKFAGPIAAAEARIAGRLDEIVENLLRLADGGYDRVVEKFEPAGLLMVDVEITGEGGEPLYDAKGAPLMQKRPAFPDLDPGEMVCVSRTRETAERDRVANIYLLDRILGKPTQAVEVAGPEGEPMARVVVVLPHNGRDALPAPAEAVDVECEPAR